MRSTEHPTRSEPTRPTPARTPTTRHPATRRRRVAVGLALLVGGAALAGCGSDAATTAEPATTTVPRGWIDDDPGASDGSAVPAGAALTSTDDCDALLHWITDQAARQVGPYGFGYAYGSVVPAAGFDEFGPVPTTAVPAEGDVAAAERAAEPTAGGGSSSTNVQEEGVDEPDIVENDGRRIISVVGGELRVVDATAEAPSVVGSLALDGYDHQLLVDGDRALVLSTGELTTGDLAASSERQAAADAAGATIAGGLPTTRLTVVDLSDPSAPSVVDERLVDGWLVSARMVDGTARVVVQTTPAGPPITYPNGVDDEARAAAENRRAVRRSTLADWLPAVHEPTRGGGWDSRPVDCGSVAHPAEYAGLGSVTVLTTDVAGSLDDLAPVTVVADASQVYASASTLTVAATRWPSSGTGVMWEDDETWEDDTSWAEDPGAATVTDLHQFDLPADRPAVYVASGTVAGTLLGQFSMSEHEGVLRVATTEGQAWDEGAGESESFVTTFRRDGDRLTQLGRVGGMGHGELIHAVRFMGTAGYVVTFEQTDPLYTLDLSDPTDPRVVGELKIPGYSAYLHPIGDGLLLGVGQDATAEGVRLGAQVSLFDVSDPANPQRIDTFDLGDGTTQVEWDHHAFLWWADTDLAVIPTQSWGDGQQSAFSGVVGLTADASGLRSAGRLPVGTTGSGGDCPPDAFCTSAVAYADPANRSMVVDGALWVLSGTGLVRADLATLEATATVTF